MVMRAWLLALVAALAGCGEETHADSFATLRVRLPVSVAHADVRIAVVWSDHGEDRRQARATESHSVIIGESVAVPLRVVPDDDAYRTWDPIDGELASAGLVAFVDRNGNGTLDLTAVSDSGFRDDVVGWAAGVRLVMAPAPTADSILGRGLNVLRYVDDDFGPRSERLPTDAEIPVPLFDAPEAACFGLTPVPGAMPAAVADVIDALVPRPARRWPYDLGAPACPDNALPNDWYRISCGATPGAYDVQLIDWPWDDDIAELCGWVVSFCRIAVDPSAALPPEFPSCE